MFLIDVTPIPEKDLYRLNKSVMVEGYLIPRGFEWDGASIPRFLWRVVASPFQPKLMAPSMVHDYLYTYPQGLKRKEVDKLFKKLLIHNGVSKSLADTIYSGVRWGGGSHFNGDT